MPRTTPSAGSWSRAPSGWYPDPIGRHKTRWWDGNNWRGWVDGDRSGEADPLSNAKNPDIVVSETPNEARARRLRSGLRRGFVIAAAIALVFGLPLFLFGLVVNQSENEGKGVAESFVSEMDSWDLPDTVARAKQPDDVSPGVFGSSTPSVRRYFVPQHGATAREAAADLVAALREQGYEDIEPLRRGFSYGSCVWQKCDFDIMAFEGQIEVSVS
jgi:Protein of unknown function (DUF2510)